MMPGYVLAENDGEHLFQRSGEIVIKIDRPVVRMTYALARNGCR
jgi:hypothetical protein